MSEQPIDLKRGLLTWAKQEGIRAPDFAAAMNYTYNHAYQLLHGDTEVAEATLGRLVLSYGPGAVAEIIGLAKTQDQPITQQ